MRLLLLKDFDKLNLVQDLNMIELKRMNEVVKMSMGSKLENEINELVDQMKMDEMIHTDEFHLDSNWLTLANDFDLLTNNRDKVWENSGVLVENADDDGDDDDDWWKVHY